MEIVEIEFDVPEHSTFSVETTQIIESLGLSNSDSIHGSQIIAICNSPTTRECLSRLIGHSRSAAQIATSLETSITSTWESAINEWVISREGFVPSTEFKETIMK